MLVVLALASCGRAGFDPIAGPAADADSDALGATDAIDAPGTAPNRSCLALPTTCGPLGTESCCANRMVSGGTFQRYRDVAIDGMFTDMTRPATVSAFRLDTYEVTVGRFREFAAAGIGTRVNPPGAGAGARMLNGAIGQGGWDTAWNPSLTADTQALVAAVKCDASYQTWTDALGANENRPMVCLTWYEAMAFCTWDGGFLPTEAESLYAASGGNMQRAFPWSSPPGSTQIDCTKAKFLACATGTNTVGSLSPAGDGAFGHADLGGNAWEWVLDWFVQAPAPSCSDCANLVPGGQRVIRGGSFGSDASYVRNGARNFNTPTNRNDVGVRCARAP